MITLICFRALYHPRESSKYSDESRGAILYSGILPENIVNKFVTKILNFLPNGLGWYFQSAMTDIHISISPPEQNEELVRGVEEGPDEPRRSPSGGRGKGRRD